MKITLSPKIFEQIHANGEASYPEEGAGLLLGLDDGQHRRVHALLEIQNAREDAARHNRYLITPEAMLQGEVRASSLGLDIVGVFHSHPDHPNRPSQFDQDWALPWYSYIITSVHQGQAVESRSWRLAEDHTSFTEEEIEILN